MKSKRYEIDIKPLADKHLRKFLKSDPAAWGKAMLLIKELYEHPRTGTGHPEQLRGDKSGLWSRRISHRHRLIYEIREDVVIVLVLSAWGHYEE